MGLKAGPGSGPADSLPPVWRQNQKLRDAMAEWGASGIGMHHGEAQQRPTVPSTNQVCLPGRIGKIAVKPGIGKETVLSTPDSKVKVLLIPTNEELMIAMDTAEIVKK